VDLPITPFRITVLRHGTLTAAFVVDVRKTIGGTDLFLWSTARSGPQIDSSPSGAVIAGEEGITWARGWSGEEVEALVVGRALL
jgi:hypothetical protein